MPWLLSLRGPKPFPSHPFLPLSTRGCSSGRLRGVSVLPAEAHGPGSSPWPRPVKHRRAALRFSPPSALRTAHRVTCSASLCAAPARPRLGLRHPPLPPREPRGSRPPPRALHAPCSVQTTTDNVTSRPLRPASRRLTTRLPTAFSIVSSVRPQLPPPKQRVRCKRFCFLLFARAVLSADMPSARSASLEIVATLHAPP